MSTNTKQLRDFDSLYELVEYFDTEEKCEQYLALLRWNGEPECPHCGHSKCYLLKGANKRYKCAKCRKLFSVRVGTIFQDSPISLRKWFIAVYLHTSHKKGISSHQLAKHLKITQKTAWFILQRIREAFADDLPTSLDGEVEADETWVGGEEKYRHPDKKAKARGTHARLNGKTPVLGIVKRGGKVYAVPVSNVRKETLYPHIYNMVEKGSTIYTDELQSYKALKFDYKHEVVNHYAKEFVRDNAHTNNIENFWSHLKRGITGTYHHTSQKHLHRYVNEFAYRYNNRKMTDGSRFDTYLANAVNKIEYSDLIGKK